MAYFALMRVCWYSIVLLLLSGGMAVAQGKLVLVGGGSEDENSWSDEPYEWAVNQSQNKKVAVISYTDEDNWIPDYFKSLGAEEADNIKFSSRAVADLQNMYDSLMQYDVFFFKGGDQSFYYEYFKDTKTEQAIIDKFNSGGVMSGTSAGMAILSSVIFSAQNGSLYPDDVLQNFKDTDITLRNDFLPFLPGYIVDTHFTERGRGSRLLAFMANWFLTTGEMLTGIGVDDRTALCIDENNIGHVYGTGAVSIYSAAQFSAFDNTKMISDSVHVTQLLYGHSIDLETLEIIEGPDDPLTPEIDSENGNYEVILSGSEGFSSNSAMLNYFVQDAGTLSDTVLVVTAPGKASAIIDRVRTLGAFVVIAEASATSNDIGNIELRNLIRKSKKILFAENDDTSVFNFLEGGPTGELINGHIRRNNMVVAFVGEDSRYAGKVFASNHLSDALAAYYGRLNFKNGLGLLPASTIMSNTYDASSTDFYENTTAAVPFAMVSNELKYGIYLNRNTFLKFYQQGGKNYWKSSGSFTSLIAVNSGTFSELASRPVNGAGAVRDYVGFLEMRYVLLNGNEQLVAGIPQLSEDEPYVPEKTITAIDEDEVLSVKVFPNPSESGIFHLTITEKLRNPMVTVSDQMGRIIHRQSNDGSNVIDLSSCTHGMYYLTVVSGKKIYTLKLIR
jgi:cyanophycinase